MELTKKEQKILNKIARPTWPKLSLFLLWDLAFLMILGFGGSLWSCFRLYRMVGAPPGFQALLDEVCRGFVYLVIAGSSAFSLVFAYQWRRHSLLLRKVYDEYKNGRQT